MADDETNTPYPDPGPHPVNPRKPLAPIPAWWQEAMDKAVRLYGSGASVGENAQYADAPFYVAVKNKGTYTHFGAGRNFIEAFANVKKVKYQRANQSFVFEGEEEPKKAAPTKTPKAKK